MKKEEIWADVSGYEGLYKISNLGKLKSLYSRGSKSDYIVKLNKNTAGYYFKSLYKNKNFKNNYIHRLVASHFVENPYNKPQVNHKDGNKINNNADNLEWVNRSENQLHAYANKLQSPKKCNYNIEVYDLNKNLIGVFERQVDIIRKLKVSKTSIQYQLSNKNTNPRKYIYLKTKR